MEIQKLLLTWDEYNQKGRFEIPYTYLIQGDNQALSYFGAQHSFDPQNSQNEQIEKLWNEMIVQYPKENIVAVIEGGLMNNEYGRDEYIIQFLKKLQDETGWNEFDFSMQHLKDIHTNIFNTAFDETDQNFFQSIVTPTNTNSVINRISRDMDVVRDTAIVQGILDEWNKGKSVFVVYGASHAVIQEKALKTLT
jgi:hypothetical protein